MCVSLSHVAVLSIWLDGPSCRFLTQRLPSTNLTLHYIPTEIRVSPKNNGTCVWKFVANFPLRKFRKGKPTVSSVVNTFNNTNAQTSSLRFVVDLTAQQVSENVYNKSKVEIMEFEHKRPPLCTARCS